MQEYQSKRAGGKDIKLHFMNQTLEANLRYETNLLKAVD